MLEIDLNGSQLCRLCLGNAANEKMISILQDNVRTLVTKHISIQVCFDPAFSRIF